MATSPSITPFFTAPYSFSTPIPTTAPMYARTTYLPPPPFVFGAPVSGSPPIPPPPTFPYAAAYPYPPPAPASPPSPTSAFPHPPNLGSTASTPAGPISPTSTPTPAPPPTGVPGSTPSSTQRWVASSPSPELDSRRIFIPTTVSVSKMQPAAAPLLGPFDTFHTSTSRMQSDDSPVAIPDHTSLLLLQESMVGMVDAMQRHNTGLYLDSAPEVFGNTPTSRPGADESIATAQARVVQAEATISKDMPRAVLDLKRRLDEQQARDRTSFETLQGELAKLTSMAAQLAISIGKHTASATPGSSPLGIIGTASVAPKVFDTLPTPSSGYENFSGHSDQSSAVHGGGTNPKEQNLDELPQAYGLHNLNCRTVVRADGSEHSYYALPGNYTLEQDMPEPLLSNKSVGVSDSNSEQQPCEEEQQVCEHPLKCLSKKIETEHTSACVSIISEVLELQPQDDGKSRNCPALKTSDPYVTRSSQFSIVCSVPEMRLLWDPGDTTSYALFTTADSATNLQCTNVYKPAVVQILAVQFGVRRVLIFKSAVMHCDALGLARTKVTGSALFVLVVPGSAGTACPSPSFANMAKLLWDPGILHYMAPNGCNSALQDNSFILQMAAHLSECKYPCSLYCICMMKAEYCPMRCLGEISVSCMKRLQYNPGDFTHILLVLCVSCRAITDDCFAGQKLMANTTRKVAALTWHGTLPGTPFILLNSTTYTWDPSVLCIRDRRLYKYTVSSQVQFVKLIEELSLTACIQHIASNNTGLDELTSPCVGFHPQQSTKWASTSPNGITSSEYAYTMDFIIGQCKFLHKQGVQSYNAKNQLFSSNSLQILEMGIIFITFLPP